MFPETDVILLTAIKKFFIERKFIDVKVARHGRELFCCHKIMLAACSTYFDNLLQSAEGCTILNVDAVKDENLIEHLILIVQFMYGSVIQVERRKLPSFSAAVRLFGVQSLAKLVSSQVEKGATIVGGENCDDETITFKPVAMGPLLLVVFQTFRKMNKFIDVEIICDGGVALYSHKLVLCSFSSYFQTLLESTEGYAVLNMDKNETFLNAFKMKNKEKPYSSDNTTPYGEQLDWLIRLMYGNKFSACDRKNVVDVDTLKDLMKIFCINLPWTKIETFIFRRRKRNKKKILELRDSLKDLVGQQRISVHLPNRTPRKITYPVHEQQNLTDLIINNSSVAQQVADRIEVVLPAQDEQAQALECSSSNFAEDLIIDGHFSALPSPTTTTSAGMSGVGETFLHSCVTCESKFDCLWDLYEHLSHAHGSKEFTCQICGENISGSLSDFQSHWNSHVVSDNKFSTPGISSRKFVDDRVTINGDSDDKRYKCSLCDESFYYESYLKRHCQRRHDVLYKTSKPFVCCHCGHATREKSALEVHIRSKHTKMKPFACDLCDYRSVTSSQLARHVRIHSGVKPYKCASCDLAFVEKRDLNVHIAKIHDRMAPFACVFCTLKFFRKDHLLNHSRTCSRQIIDASAVESSIYNNQELIDVTTKQ